MTFGGVLLTETTDRIARACNLILVYTLRKNNKKNLATNDKIRVNSPKRFIFQSNGSFSSIICIILVPPIPETTVCYTILGLTTPKEKHFE